MTDHFSNIILITGHYGCGKTNLAINLALDLKRQGRVVALADLDIVNPYFRTADFVELAEQNGIELVKSAYANSNLDIPSLTLALDAKFESDDTLIIDVGGDDAGATALGRYAPRLSQRSYDMVYVVNRYRMMISDPCEAAVMLREIETASRLKATCVVNNSHLAHETTPSVVLESLDYARAAAQRCGLPLAFSTMRRDFCEGLENKEDYFPIDILVDLPWY